MEAVIKNFLLTVLVTSIAFAANISFAAQPYAITQITDNDYDDKFPEINDNGYMVWAGDSTKIFYYNGSVATQIADNYGLDEPWNSSLDINDNGYAVWDGTNGIFLYDGSSIRQLPQSRKEDNFPKLNNKGQVVWSRSTSSPFQLYLYNGSTTTLLDYPGASPDINDNGYMAWRTEDDYAIELYDGVDVKALFTVGFVRDSDYPSINNNGDVAWMAYGSEEGNYDPFLYVYSNSTLKQITTTTINDYYPELNGNGYIAWSGGTFPNAHDTEIFLYDGSNINKITHNLLADRNPDINNKDVIVWSGFDGNDYEIYMGTPVPEPATLSLLGIGLLPLLRRKR